MKPGIRIRPDTSITAAASSDTTIFGRTSRILPSSISTSACAKSPMPRSSVKTTPPLSRMRRCCSTRLSSTSDAPCAIAASGNACAAVTPAARTALALRKRRRELIGDALLSQPFVSGVAGAVRSLLVCSVIIVPP
jgi:hypothetical protein